MEFALNTPEQIPHHHNITILGTRFIYAMNLSVRFHGVHRQAALDFVWPGTKTHYVADPVSAFKGLLSYSPDVSSVPRYYPPNFKLEHLLD
jgi:hypothetical protein